jgi:E3 Ubiquitin ligase
MDFLLLILLAVLAAFGFILLKPLAQIIRIRRVPTLPIAALPTTGQAEVVGHAGGSVVLSPISDTPCVLWQVEVQEYRGSGKNGRWVTILKQTSGPPIEIDDGTGRVWAVPAGADLVLDDDLRASRGLFGTMTPQIEAALERMGIPLRGVFGMQRALRVRERLIAPGEQIFALGLAEEAAGQLRLCSTQDAPLILADRSEHALLSSLYWQVGTSVFFALVALGIIGWLMAGGRP